MPHHLQQRGDGHFLLFRRQSRKALLGDCRNRAEGAFRMAVHGASSVETAVQIAQSTTMFVGSLSKRLGRGEKDRL